MINTLYKKRQLNAYMKKVEIVNAYYNTLTGEENRETYYLAQNELYRLALLKQTMKQLYGIELYDVQLLAILAMHDNKLVEMKTGEGKTFCIGVSALLTVTSKLTAVPIELPKAPQLIIVTTNNYLAKRDAEELNKLFDYYGLRCTCNVDMSTPDADNIKSDRFKTHIMYSDCSEICFDYLRNRDLPNKPFEILFENVIVDEVDFILIDNALTNCTVSGEAREDTALVSTAFYLNMLLSIVDNLTYTESYERKYESYDMWDVDYVVFPHTKNVYITNKGLDKVSEILGVDISLDYRLQTLLQFTLRGYRCYSYGVDYHITKDNKLCVINCNNGRASANSQYESDLQNALEVKHGLPMSAQNGRENSISYQVFFNKFNNLKGISGTLSDVEGEFAEIFDREIIAIPTNKEVIREDNKTQYFETVNEKYKDFVKELINNLPNKNPKLVIFENEVELLKVHKLFNKLKLKHNILINLTCEKEQAIIDEAGKPYAITLSTSLMGRGTDIKTHGLPLELYCLSHFINPRIDNQVRGRSGRQGNPGVTYFYSSIQDSLYSYCNEEDGNNLHKLVNKDIHKLDKFRLTLQRQIYSRQYSSRKAQYVYSYVGESIRSYWLEIFKQRLLNPTEDYFSKLLSTTYVDANLFVDKEEVSNFYNAYSLDDIINRISDKIRDYSSLDSIMLDYYDSIRLSLKDIESSVATKSSNTHTLITEYTLIANSVLLYHQKEFIYKLLNQKEE